MIDNMDLQKKLNKFIFDQAFMNKSGLSVAVVTANPRSLAIDYDDIFANKNIDYHYSDLRLLKDPSEQTVLDLKQLPQKLVILRFNLAQYQDLLWVKSLQQYFEIELKDKNFAKRLILLIDTDSINREQIQQIKVVSDQFFNYNVVY